MKCESIIRKEIAKLQKIIDSDKSKPIQVNEAWICKQTLYWSLMKCEWTPAGVIDKELADK